MKNSILVFTFLVSFCSYAQESVTYQKPSKEILDLVDVPIAPSVFIDDASEYMIFAYRDSYKSIDELSQKELRLAGLRINPKTNIGSRVTYYNQLKIKNLTDPKPQVVDVSGLPSVARLSNFAYSPDQQKIACTNTTPDGVEVWVLDIPQATAKKLTEAKANANLGDVINWFTDGSALLVKMIAQERKSLINTDQAVPVGPTVSVSDGKEAQNRTYQDLLKNKDDEHNFEQLAMSELYKVSLDGSAGKWLGAAMYRSISFSPDGNYVMVTTLDKPFSYLVPYYRFPSKTNIYTKDAQFVQTIVEVPLIEDLPKGFMAVRTGRRNIDWRDDRPHWYLWRHLTEVIRRWRCRTGMRSLCLMHPSMENRKVFSSLLIDFGTYYGARTRWPLPTIDGGIHEIPRLTCSTHLMQHSRQRCFSIEITRIDTTTPAVL
jgi:hypothetical protein